ncbi:class I SAM-dependent methyltransferase [Marivibrio halodurans]|uniref:Class I SAM-dependent methyltransferase n=1 Tax=Marivibrio halodurans TaxID=2039722 RepID=A0A8J7V113_9PROT|nr:class I SAM-dependent methyltransferase [Marivibrio halodurans]MBP5855626.1 class I SAM-dependent methyltransferase [Marivibrio halodurans]
MKNDLGERTIEDFGDQWTRYTGNEGYYGSVELLADILEPLVPIQEIHDKRIAEIGSGSGRIVRMLLGAGAKHVTAIEPSRSMNVLKKNTEDLADQIRYVEAPGQEMPVDDSYDMILSIGVLHHIPNAKEVVERARQCLKDDGLMIVWLYGKEGNEAYLGLFLPLRVVTSRLPHGLLSILCHALNVILSGYIWMAHWLPVPLRGYMRNVIGKFSREKRYLVIYDQLKPAYAKYYSQKEAIDLLSSCGLSDIATHHRHGYSWTVVGYNRGM